MNNLHRSLLLIGIVVCLLFSGCTSAKDLAHTLEEVSQVRDAIMKQFGEKDVGVNVNNFNGRSSVSVLFVNSPLIQKNHDARLNQAKETAELVKRKYPDIKSVDNIMVSFNRVTTRLVLFHWSETVDFYAFDNDGQLVFDVNKNMEPSVDNPTEPIVNYYEKQDRTELAVGAIQLEGSPENGVTCLPRASFTGNLKKGTGSRPEVSIDFASYAEKPRFPNLTRIVFLTDGKVAYATNEQFSTSKLSDGMFSEFLYLKVPRAAFVRITSGKTMTLKLGDKSYSLDEQQVEMLQKMAGYLKE